MKILITGAAGFIGFHLSSFLLNEQHEVVGLDNLNDYYDVNIKKARLDILSQHSQFTFYKSDLADLKSVEEIFNSHQFDVVINLAAQAGVRYSLENPHCYIQSNVVGFCNILECCRHHHVGNLIYASSSSVYGANTLQPFSESHSTEHPLALYGATKKANELMAHTYASLYGLPCTGLRFFTVYGPWGRPDMALFKFTKNILEDKPIDVYNHGKMIRDFTYVTDVAQAISHMIHKPATANKTWDSNNPDPGSSYCPYQIYNIGNSRPTELMEFIRAIEECLGNKAKINFMDMQAGDVPATNSDTTKLANDFDYKPKTPVKAGIKQFIEWYRQYYKV